MNAAPAGPLKLAAVLDLAAAEGLLATMRERARTAPGTRIDASAVDILTLPCIQVILSAAGSGHKVAIVDPSEAFAAAFSDLGLDWPRDEVTDEPVADDSAAASSQPVSPAPETDVPPALSPTDEAAMPIRILTIDDSKTIRDMLRMTLADAGFEVLQAVDGQDGVEVMDRERVDLVITDINMPRMNGYEVVRHLRGNPSHKSLPILVLTTESDSDKKNLAREAGATGWMVKPFDPDRLVETVRKVIPHS